MLEASSAGITTYLARREEKYSFAILSLNTDFGRAFIQYFNYEFDGVSKDLLAFTHANNVSSPTSFLLTYDLAYSSTESTIILKLRSLDMLWFPEFRSMRDDRFSEIIMVDYI